LGETVTVEGAEPVAALNPSQLDVTLADQLREPVPRLDTWNVCGTGLSVEAPKKVSEEGVTDKMAVLIASVTGIVIGEFAAPGAESLIDPL